MLVSDLGLYLACLALLIALGSEVAGSFNSTDRKRLRFARRVVADSNGTLLLEFNGKGEFLGVRHRDDPPTCDAASAFSSSGAFANPGKRKSQSRHADSARHRYVGRSSLRRQSSPLDCLSG